MKSGLGRQDSELLHEGQLIHREPVFNDLPVTPDPVSAEIGVIYRLAFPRRPYRARQRHSICRYRGRSRLRSC